MNATAVLLGLLVSTDIEAAPQQVPQFEMQISTRRLSDDLHLLEGAGGNVLAFVWDEGVLLVDDKIGPVSAKLKAAVGEITTKPIRFVVNTHWHPDHRGGNETLADDGTVIVAHENVRSRMSVESFIAVFGRNMPPSPPQALPVVTFTRDVTFHLGGEEISVTHVDAAHTDGDAFVRFRKANVLHLGDCYLNGSFPVIDYSSNGTFTGTIAAADTALAMADAKTRIVPGHGPVSDARELREWRDMLATIYSRVKAAAQAGKTLAQIKAEKPAREWEGRLPRSFVTSDHPVEEAFRSATADR
jgi:cyclase